MRTHASPRAGLVVVADVAPPTDWPSTEGVVPHDAAAANLGHALGWTCEVRRNDLVLLNPLGEGLLRCELPTLSADWSTHVRRDGSCAIYLAPIEVDDEGPEPIIAAAAALGSLTAATVRTAIAADHGQVAPPGRNAPCPCGSGKKYKHCHG